jgi:aminopeptidase
VDTGRGLVVFSIDQNRAVAVRGEEPAASEEADHLRREPAYGNMAELGFGVLADFGLAPVGEILLDEKLGLHIAFGRSDHFGGAVSPKDFSSPSEVIHLDRIYIPQSQPRVAVRSVVLIGQNGDREEIMRDGAYRIF